MSHSNTIRSQLFTFVPRHELVRLAKNHYSGRSLRTASRRSQFNCLAIAQLSGRNSSRDVVESMYAQAHRLYHLGSAKLTRSNLSRINESKPYELYEVLFTRHAFACQSQTKEHLFMFNSPLYRVDALTIDLCLPVFPLANFRSTKGAIKLYVGSNYDGCLPEFVSISDGSCAGMTAGRRFNFPKGSIIAITLITLGLSN